MFKYLKHLCFCLLFVPAIGFASDLYLNLPPAPAGHWHVGEVFAEGFDSHGLPWAWCSFTHGYGRSGGISWYKCGFDLAGNPTYLTAHSGTPNLTYGSYVEFTAPGDWLTYGWLQGTSSVGNLLYITDTLPYRQSVLVVP